ncbi:MAG: hypothetical protein IT410_04510 [Candidatus Doudnabacteria bacterium]|nr:hypothetical protein [Candidatus Doudnabacteria bacterium]
MKISIDPILCKYQFLHHLSGWHYSSRTSFGQYWRSVPGKLSYDEVQAVKNWTALSKRVFAKENLFLAEKYLSGTLSVDEETAVQAIFEVLGGRFGYHYKKQFSNIKKVSLYLSRSSLDRYVQDTFRFYKVKPKLPPVYITLSYNAQKEAGGMYLGKGVVIEFGDWKLGKDNEPLVNVAIHELTHGVSLIPLLPRTLRLKLPEEFNSSAKDFMEEVVHNALWSQIGVFTQKVFRFSDTELDRRFKRLMRIAPEPYKSLFMSSYSVRSLLQGHLAAGKSLNNYLLLKLIQEVRSSLK